MKIPQSMQEFHYNCMLPKVKFPLHAPASRAWTLGIQSLMGIFWGQRSSHSWQAMQAAARADSGRKI
jgi:hypothetical protein